MAEQGWHQAEIILRRAVINARCTSCETDGTHHPAHAGRRCMVRILGEQCDCTGADDQDVDR